MRLLAVVDGTGFGGAELCLGHVLAGLPGEVSVTVAGPHAPTVARIAGHRPGAEGIVVPRPTVRAYLAVLRRVRPDVVHVNQAHAFDAPAALTAATAWPRARVVVVDHLPTRSSQRRRTLYARRVLDRLADAHVAVGAGAARAVEREVGLPAGRVGAIANGVPPHVVPAVPPPTGLPPGPVVGGAGRLTAQKGFDVLVDAVAGLPGVGLLLVGDGPERAALEARARTAGMADRLRITGWTDRPTDWLAAVDVFALPSRHEGMPLSIIEAMHAGLPVVATDVGSVAEIVRDGVTGVLVGVDDAPALAAALARLLRDPAGARTLGAAGRALAARDHTAAAMSHRYADLYTSVLAGRGR